MYVYVYMRKENIYIYSKEVNFTRRQARFQVYHTLVLRFLTNTREKFEGNVLLLNENRLFLEKVLARHPNKKGEGRERGLEGGKRWSKEKTCNNVGYKGKSLEARFF